MKEEIYAAADFLSRIFLGHEKTAKEKVQEFNTNLAQALQERFRDHWHESFPTKGQAYRCIRICPEEPLDPLLEKVCNQVGVCVGDFNLPMELTLWVDPKEVVCKLGDLKCSYHVVAKKDNSGTVNNQTEQLDIEDLVESARELYQKKQSMMAHPLNSSEIHIPAFCPDGTANRFSTALRINGTMHYNIYSTSPGSSYDGSPRGKGKSGNSPHHKRGNNGGGFHYYGKSNGPKGGGGGGFMANGNGHSGMNSHQGGNGGGGFHRNHHHHHNHHHHSHSQGSSSYQNGYMNGYHEDNGYHSYGDQRSVSPSKMNGGGGGGTTNGLPPLASMSQSSPTPEQIQQQMQHPPPMPPPMPPHLHQPYSQPPPPTTDPASLSMPPPPPGSQTNQSSQSVSSAIFASSSTATTSSMSITNSSSNTNNNNNNHSSGGKMSTHNNSHNHNNHASSKFQSNRGGNSGSRGNNTRQMSPVKDVK